MGELHSITGMFYQSFPGTTPWGGYLLRGVEPADPEGIEGLLVDIFGRSEIRGSMTEDSLTFGKQYGPENRNQFFNYTFTRNDKGVWVGEFDNGAGYHAHAVARTTLAIPDLEFRTFDLRTPESYASALIDSMAEGGMIEKFPDPVTGEEMIRPLRLDD